MKLVKNMLKTLLITIGIAIMIVLVGFAIMMFFHVSLFGYTFVNHEDVTEKVFAESEVNTLNKIEIDTDKANIIVAYTETDSTGMIVKKFQDFQGVFKDNLQRVIYVSPGFNEEEVEKLPTTDYDIKISGNTLKIRTIEPKGLYFKNDSKITIYLPKNKVLDNLVIESASKVINIGNDKAFEVKNLEITANKPFFPSTVQISDKLVVKEDLKVKTNYGRIAINSDLRGNVTIDSLGGSITFNTNITGNVTIKGVNPAVEFGHFPMDLQYNKNYDYSSITRYNIGGNLIVDECTDGGNVKVTGSISGFAYIRAPYLEFWASEINQGLTCVGGFNEVRVYEKLIGATSSIESGDGSVYINHAHCKLDINSNKGTIEIANAHNNVEISNTYGDIIVNFANSEFNKTINATAQHGRIKATNIIGKATLIANGGNVDAQFYYVFGQNTIRAKFNANIVVEDNRTFEFIAKAKSAKIDVVLGSVEFHNWDNATPEDGWKTVSGIVNSQGYTPGESITVEVTDNGSITASIAQD